MATITKKICVFLLLCIAIVGGLYLIPEIRAQFSPHSDHEIVSWMHDQGLTMYNDVDKFRANDYITRGEASKFTSNFAKFLGLTPDFSTCNFYDIATYDVTLTTSIHDACAYGLLKGSNGYFYPNDNMSLAQGITLVVRSKVGFLDETGDYRWESYITIAKNMGLDIPSVALGELDSIMITRGELGELFYQAAHTSVNNTVPQDANVLLIILDDIGLDYFPGFMEDQGFDKASMPVIEELAQDSFLFTNLHVYPVCSPTRASLITGKHGSETGVLDAGRTSYLDPSNHSLQQELKDLSGGEIATALFGKWHLVGNKNDDLNHPNGFGIDYYEGMIKGTHSSYNEREKVSAGNQQMTTTYSTTEFTDDAIDRIGQQKGSWFTWLAYTAPHTPLHLPPLHLHSFDDLSGDEQDLKRNKNEYFKAMLESVDTEIGRLLGSMDTETRNKTYIIIMGDNGSGKSVAPQVIKSVGAKGSLHFGGINTPMIVYSPFINGNNKEYDHIISGIDFFPSIVELFGFQTKQVMPGSSFAPLVTNNTSMYRPNTYVFSQSLEGAMVSTDLYKLIRMNDGEELLYDIIEDRFEQNILPLGDLSLEQQDTYEILTEVLDKYLEGDYGNSFEENIEGVDSVTESATTEVGVNSLSSYLGAYTLDDEIYGNRTTVTLQQGVRNMVTNALPNHETGTFPTNGNPNAISAQDTSYSFSLSPTYKGIAQDAREPIIGINGVKFEPGTAERVYCESGEEFNLEGLQEIMNLGIDKNHAHVQPTGAYHYHGVPTGLVEFSDQGTSDLVHIGFAKDGYLVYYSKSGAYSPSYKLVETERSGIDCTISGPSSPTIQIEGTTPDGSLTQDRFYDSSIGDLDECNGREIDGEYVYIVTYDFPYIGRCLKGEFEEEIRPNQRRR